MTHFILMLHAMIGMMFILAAGWVYVDTLNVTERNIARIRALSAAVAVLMWLVYLVGGYWYVVNYAPEKAIILKGPWPFAHNFFTETKEHVLLMLVLLATFLPIPASNDLVNSRAARKITLWVTGIMVVLGAGMEGAGAVISMGVKVGLLPH